MIWIMGVTLVFFIGSVKNLFFDDGVENFIDFVGKLFETIMFTFFGFVMGIVIALIIGIFVDKQWREIDSYKLVSLRNGDGASGSVFLGTGRVESDEYYFYNAGTQDKFTPGKIEVENNVTVFQDSGRTNGTLTAYVLGPKNQGTVWYSATLPDNKYEFHIPKGSLRSGFALH